MKLTFDPGDQVVLRSRLGLAANASNAEIGAAIQQLLAAPAPAEGAAVTAAQAPDGHDLIAAAVADGRIPASRGDHYAHRYADDPDGTAKLIARLEPGSASFAAAGAGTSADSAYPAEWLPEIHGGRRERVMGE